MPITTPQGQPSSPRVSVIISCFNLGQYLDEAVDSLVAQTFSDYEIVIVDDGSTDELTCRVLDTWNRPGTRIIRSPENRGLPAAKNLGLRHTTGEFVCMFDADDRAHPELLARSVAALDADASLAFVSHWVQTFGDDTSVWPRTDCDFPALLHHNRVNGAAVVRRSAVDAVGGFDETFREGCEDWDFWITLVERGLRGRVLAQPLYEYRRHQGSMTSAMDMERRHPSLCRRLVIKHADAYRSHVQDLRRRRERDLAALRQDLHRMELDLYERLEPGLLSRRDDVATRMCDTPARPAQPESNEAAPVSSIHLQAAQLAEEVRALRTSISWRVTGPGRAVYDLWRRVRGRS
jgi:glycosyltransferase involved in cell wall biosynthesis